MSTIADKAAAVPDGLHHRRGVEYLAALRGLRYRDGELPDKLIFGEAAGFSEPVAFVKASKADGYYLVRRDQCSCPSYRYRGGECKHMKAVRGDLERKARIDERNAKRAEEKARAPKVEERPFRGFNSPDEVRA